MDEKMIALVITLVTASAYLSGYGFLYGYYQYFDVSVWELDLSVQDILVHASSSFLMTIKKFFLLLLVALIAPALVLVRLYAGNIDSRKLMIASTPIIITFLMISLFTSVSFGRTKASEELRLLNPVVVAGLAPNIASQSPLQLQGLQFLHLATTIDTFFVIGIYQTGQDRWVGRISREDDLASFVYQDP